MNVLQDFSTLVFITISLTTGQLRVKTLANMTPLSSVTLYDSAVTLCDSAVTVWQLWQL